MDPRSFVENLFGGQTDDQSPHAYPPQFDSEFVGLNDIPIPDNVENMGADDPHGSNHPIDLDDIEEEEEATEEDVQILDPRGKRKTKKSAKCWEHFKLVSTASTDGSQEFKAVCKYCSQRLAWQKGIGTTHLNRHYRKCSYKHGLVGASQTQLQFGTSSSGTSSTSTSTLSTWIYSEDKAREGLVKFIAGAELPLSFVENPHFTEFVQQNLQPRYSGVSRNTIRADTIQYFIRAKKRLISDLHKYGGVISFTSDIWEGINRRGYIAATAHYIDPNWVIHKKIIAFKLIEYPHNVNNVFNALLNIIKEYKCESKIRSFTVDNASYNKGVLDKLQRVINPEFGSFLFHIRCVCHILNLIVQDGLKHIKNEIDRIRNAIGYISISSSRVQSFEEYCSQFNMTSKKFITDVGHRWNSTYLLLKSCEGYEPLITDFYNSRHVNDEDHDILGESDWEAAIKIKRFLKPFYESTEILSGVYYPTSSKVLERLYVIARTFRKYRNDPFFTEILISMELKFRKYWEDLPMLFPLACVMDPRYNLKGTKFVIRQISDALNFDSPITYTNLETTLISMYEVYVGRMGGNVQRTPVAPPTSENLDDDSVELLNLFQGIREDRIYSIGSSSSMSDQTVETGTPAELLNYFNYEIVQPNNQMKEELLDFWRSNERKFPIVSAIAKDLLTPPVSTVASESAFSTGKRTLTEVRSRLKEDILEALMCVKDWQDGEHRIQDKYVEIACAQVNDI